MHASERGSGQERGGPDLPARVQQQEAEVMAPKRYREAAKAMQDLNKALASGDLDISLAILLVI